MCDELGAGVPAKKCTRMVRTAAGIEIELLEKRGAHECAVALLLHGMGVGAHYWDLPVRGYSTMDNLAARGLRVYAMELRGYGKGSAVPGDSVRSSNVAEDVSAVIDFVKRDSGAEHICLVGHSWGAVMATIVAARRSDSVECLVVISMMYRHLNPVVQSLLEATRTSSADEDGWIPNQTHVGLSQSTFSYDAEVLDIYNTMVSSQYPRIPLGILGEIPALPHLESVACVISPTLVICGALDPLVDPADAVALLNDLALPEKELLFVGNAAHNMALEKLAHSRVDQAIAGWALEHRRTAQCC